MYLDILPNKFRTVFITTTPFVSSS